MKMHAINNMSGKDYPAFIFYPESAKSVKVYSSHFGVITYKYPEKILVHAMYKVSTKTFTLGSNNQE